MAKALPTSLFPTIVVALAILAVSYHFRYLLMKTEVRRGRLVVDKRSGGIDCHLVDTKRDADTEWPVEQQLARMFRLSDGLEASFCEDHASLLEKDIVVRGVRVAGEAIGQDCTNRSCFAWVRLEPN